MTVWSLDVGDRERRLRSRSRWLVVWAWLASSACTYSLPLGGVAAGRGRPLGADRVQFGGSLGTFVEVAGTLPALEDEYGSVVNPIPDRGRGATSTRGLDLLGLSYGFTDWLDLGLNFSRGLHGFVRLAGDDAWGLSLSPSLFRYSSDQGGTDVVGVRRGAVTNLSVAVLGSYVVPVLEDRRIEVYGGGTLSRYAARIRTDVDRVERSATVPSLVGGFRSLRTSPRTGRGSRSSDVVLGLGLEGAWSWVRQRDGRRDLVPTLRGYFSITGTNR